MFLNFVVEAELRKEVYIAILRSALKVPKSKRDLAKKVGISPQYLSYLLNPSYSRTPSPKLAERIVQILPLDSDQRITLLEHMLFVSKHAPSERIRLELQKKPIGQTLDELRAVQITATFAPDPITAKTHYRVLREITKTFLKQLNPQVQPLVFVEVCLILHEAQCVLNRADDALYHAKLARNLIENLDARDYRQDRERFDHFQVNVILAEGLAYHNLRLFDESHASYLAVENKLEEIKYQANFWNPHLYRNKINSLSSIPRFAISEVEALVDRGRAICEQRAQEQDLLLILLLNESLGRAYIQHDNLKKARRLLQAQIDELYKVPKIGHLHRTIILRTFARLLWKETDIIEWELFIREAVRTAFSAGLDHQLNEMKKEYGDIIAPIFQSECFFDKGSNELIFD